MQNNIFEKREYNNGLFMWNAIIYKDQNLNENMKLISEEIKNIKKVKKIENNIIIGKEVNTNIFFDEIKKINKDILIIKALTIYISKTKLESIKFPDLRTITNIYGQSVNDKNVINNKIKEVII